MGVWSLVMMSGLVHVRLLCLVLILETVQLLQRMLV